MRMFVVAAICALLAAYTVGWRSKPFGAPAGLTPSPSVASSPAASASASAPRSTATVHHRRPHLRPHPGPRPCALLSTAQVEDLVGGPVGEADAGRLVGVPSCQWVAAGGRFVQALQTNASHWARSLPEAVRVLRKSGRFIDRQSLRMLQNGADLVAAGRRLPPRLACSYFATLAEVQGLGPTRHMTVTVSPTRAEPKAVTGQACSGGQFTSVMVADPTGMEQPLPLQPVQDAAVRAHVRALQWAEAARS